MIKGQRKRICPTCKRPIFVCESLKEEPVDLVSQGFINKAVPILVEEITKLRRDNGYMRMALGGLGIAAMFSLQDGIPLQADAIRDIVKTVGEWIKEPVSSEEPT